MNRLKQFKIEMYYRIAYYFYDKGEALDLNE